MIYRFLLAILLFLPSLAFSTGDTLIIGYTPAPPFVIDGVDGPSGINIWLWEKLSQDLDQPYKLVSLPWQELVPAIKSGHIDISINPLTLTAERAADMLFTSPFYVSYSTVVMPKRQFSQLKNFIETVFSWEFFAGIFSLMLIISIFGAVTWLFERKQNEEQFRNNIKGLWDGIWWSAVTMTTIGYGDKAPKTRGGKIVALLWMFTALLFISGLTASIASTLLANNKGQSISDINELRKMEVGTIANTGTEGYLKARFFKNISLYSNVNEGLDAIENKEIDAFIYDKPIVAYTLKERTSDDLATLPLKFNSEMYGFAVSKKQNHLLPRLSERILFYTHSLEWPILLHEYNLEL